MSFEMTVFYSNTWIQLSKPSWNLTVLPRAETVIPLSPPKLKLKKRKKRHFSPKLSCCPSSVSGACASDSTPVDEPLFCWLVLSLSTSDIGELSHNVIINPLQCAWKRILRLQVNFDVRTWKIKKKVVFWVNPFWEEPHTAQKKFLCWKWKLSLWLSQH